MKRKQIYLAKIYRYSLTNRGAEHIKTVVLTGKEFDKLKKYSKGYNAGFYKYEIVFDGKVIHSFNDYSPLIIDKL